MIHLEKPYNVLIAGVGGQGNLLCGRVLAEAAISEGHRPTIGETFGASRRGGTVFTHVRIGNRDLSPLIPRGTVDMLIGLELMESLRAAVDYCGEHTVAVVSTAIVQTMQCVPGAKKYPPLAGILDVMSSICASVSAVDPMGALGEAKYKRVLNSFMLGAALASGIVPLKADRVRDSLTRLMQPVDLNVAAFDEGLKATAVVQARDSTAH